MLPARWFRDLVASDDLRLLSEMQVPPVLVFFSRPYLPSATCTVRRPGRPVWWHCINNFRISPPEQVAELIARRRDTASAEGGDVNNASLYQV